MKKRSAAETSTFLALARARKKQADDAEQKQLVRELADLRFLVDQWPQELQDSRAGEPASGSRAAIPARPCLSIDTLRDPIAHVKAEAEQTDLGPELTPADDFGGLTGPIDDTEIELREGLVRKIQRDSDARDARNWAADRARKCGRGYYLVMTRYTSSRSMDQEVYVERLYNQSTVRLDPRHEKPTGSDAEWEFWGTDMSWEAYKAEHPDRESGKAEHDDDAEWRGLGDEAPDWFTGDGDTRSVRVMNYCYTEFDAVTLVQLADGSLVPTSEAKDQPRASDEDGNDLTRRDVKKTIWWAKIDGAQILDETEWLCEFMPIVKVVWEEVQPFDSERRVQGMVRPARDPAFGVSVMATTEVEVALLAPKTPVLGAAGQFEGFEAAWDVANVRNIGRLEYNSKTDEVPTGGLPPPQALQRNTDVGMWDGLREMFLRAVKSSTGVPDATLGNVDPSVRSGRGIKLLQEQARQGTSGGLMNLVKSVTYEGQIINALLYPIYGRRPGRLLQMMTGKHESQGVLVDQPFVRDAKQKPQPFDPQQHPDQQPQKYVLTEGAVFNLAIRVSKDYDTRRQEEASTLGELIQSDPQLMTWFGDLYFENQDGPGHKDMAKRAKLMLAPPILASVNQEGGASQIPPEVQAQMQQLQQKLQEATQFIQTEQAKQQGQMQVAQVKAQTDGQSAQMDAQLKMAIAQLQAQTDLKKAEMDNATKLQLAEYTLRGTLMQGELDAREQQLGAQQQVSSQAHEAGMAAMGHVGAREVQDRDQRHAAEQAASGQQHESAEADAARQAAAEQAQAGMSHEQQMAEQAQAVAAEQAAQQGPTNG
ncbi:MAG TPA: hypothetical protein VK595_00670 [Vicinamibacterales bacterium]|nr:hypothetical protein [Vicinamibacterales bacterium]